MELRSKVRVQYTVDVLEVGTARVSVELVRLGVWSVEMAASGCGLLSEHASSGTSHHLHQIHT